MTKNSTDLYARLIETIFYRHYQPGDEIIRFTREELVSSANELGLVLPKNLGDVVYSFKFRRPLPLSILEKAPDNKHWVIVNKGRGLYAFETRTDARILPDPLMTITKIPDATPGIVAKYALNDEQALLTKLRYNRLIDIFTSVTCYSLQNHLRTTVPNFGQVETDELYVGVDRKGEHYVFPVQAKGGSDELGVVQIEQDIALCTHKFPSLTCRAIAAQFMEDEVIALFEFELLGSEVRKANERHYKLVLPDELTQEDLARYRQRFDASGSA